MYATRSRRVKTDRRDARALAEACRLGRLPPRPSPLPIPSVTCTAAWWSATPWSGRARAISRSSGLNAGGDCARPRSHSFSCGKWRPSIATQPLKPARSKMAPGRRVGRFPSRLRVRPSLRHAREGCRPGNARKRQRAWCLTGCCSLHPSVTGRVCLAEPASARGRPCRGMAALSLLAGWIAILQRTR